MEQIFDWVVIGGGGVGITAAEILSREGLKVLLIEKNTTLASECSSLTNEWGHTNLQYTFTKRTRKKLTSLLQSLNDVFTYYSHFKRMNLFQTENGLEVGEQGWFLERKFQFDYRLKRLNLFWLKKIANSVSLLEVVKSHDWLREPITEKHLKYSWKTFLSNLGEIFTTPVAIYSLVTSEHAIRSRAILTDLIGAALQSGLKIETGQEVIDYVKASDGSFTIKINDDVRYRGKNIALCVGNFLDPQKIGLKVTSSTTFTPIALIKNISGKKTSFQYLDNNFNPHVIINTDGWGVVSLLPYSSEALAIQTIEGALDTLRSLELEFDVVDISCHKEILCTPRKQKKEKLYSISKIKQNEWVLTSQDFLSLLSLAPEFLRQVLNKNPRKYSALGKYNYEKHSALVSPTYLNKKKSTNLYKKE